MNIGSEEGYEGGDVGCGVLDLVWLVVFDVLYSSEEGLPGVVGFTGNGPVDSVVDHTAY